MNQREKGIAIILVLVAAVWAKTVFLKKPKKPSSRPAVPANVVPQQGKTVKAAEEELSLDEALRRMALKKDDQPVVAKGDPFQKFSLKKKIQSMTLEFSDLALSGIMWEAQQPVALINGEILKVGDTVAGFRVESIKPGEVVVTRGMEKHVMQLLTTPEGE